MVIENGLTAIPNPINYLTSNLNPNFLAGLESTTQELTKKIQLLFHPDAFI
jgi:hypothetical protein